MHNKYEYKDVNKYVCIYIKEKEKLFINGIRLPMI